ncbi:MAG: TetR/AcrR family transcriptional regulator [Oscillospiraceae bacterium]|nr:TetR/AcrR family transcriptional regulator [Oscillospiraceae bacterium]MBQ5341996.1 TetR/AcrR family transcriptional regulator [Oscillospiraceae bacterium]
MANKKTEQREASNRRILDSALNEFAEKGFSRALLIDIARNANVSNGMVTQRFNGKDNLYNQVFIDLVTIYLRKFNENDSLYKMLNTIVDDIKTGAEENTKNFTFISDLLLSKDSPVNSFDQIRKTFEASPLSGRIAEGVEHGLIRKGDPFDIIRTFLVSAVGIAKSYSGTSVGLPASSGFLSLLAPSDRQLSGDPDYLRSRLTESLISQLSYEYEAVVLVNLDTNTFVITKAVGPFSDFKPERELSFDKNIKRYADSFVHPDDRKRYRDFMKRSSLLRRFNPDEQLSISYRVNDAKDIRYQTVIRFNNVSRDGHWITAAIKNMDRLVHEEVRSALTEAQERKDSLSSGLAGIFDVTAYLQTDRDELTFYALGGDFGKMAGRMTRSSSGSSDLVSIVSSMLSDSDRERVSELIRRAISDVSGDPGSIRLIQFDCLLDLRKFRCIMELRSLSDGSGDVVIGLTDIDKFLQY